MFERTWRLRDIPGSMLVRVSVDLSPAFLLENHGGRCCTYGYHVCSEMLFTSWHLIAGCGSAGL